MKKGFIKTLFIALGGISVLGGIVWIAMLLWNGIMPELTGWKEIGYWQCAGLCVMFRLMTGHIGISYCEEEKRKSRRKHRHLHEKWRGRYGRPDEQQDGKDDNIISDNND